MTMDIGTLAAEAGQLLDVVAQRLTAARMGERPATEVCPSCGHDPSASCTACPVCRFLAVLRGERPEVTARWIDSALTVVAALKAMLPPADGPEGPSAADPTAAVDKPTPVPAQGMSTDDAMGRPLRPPGLEHIDIR